MRPERHNDADLAAFRDRALEAIAAAGQGTPTMPTLVIHMGAADANAITDAMRSRPACAVLLLVAPGEQVLSPPGDVPGAAACLAVSSSSIPAMVDRVGLLVSLLPAKRINVRVEPALARVFEPARRAAAEAIEVVLVNDQQDRNRGLIRLRSSLANLPSILAQGARMPAPLPAGASTVVCGAGPSLPAQFGTLRRYRDRLVVVAVGHAVAPLVGEGIHPDVVVEVDAHAGPNWPAGLRTGALLVACADVAPDVAARFRDIVWCAGSSLAFTAAMHRHGVPLAELNLGRTVTVTAIDFVLRLGGRRVALIGQDLCLAPDGRSHADGETAADGDERIQVPGSCGGTVVTTRDFDHLRRALERFLREATTSTTREGTPPSILNCTPGGALIEGIQSVSFDAFCEGIRASHGGWHSDRGPSAPRLPPAGLAEERDALVDYARRSEELAEEARRMQRDLRKDPLPMSRIRRSQKVVQDGVAELLRLERESPAADWLAPAVALAERTMGEGPAAAIGSRDPLAALAVIEARHSFAGDLARDLAGDLGRTLGGAGMPADEPRPLESAAFRNHGLACLRKMGGDLSSRLARGAATMPAGVRFRWFNQYLPLVTISRGGRDVPLTAMVGMHDEARRQVEQFSVSVGDAPRSGAVFAGAGGWTHICEWARRFPAAPVAVLEPWPGVLAELIAHGCLLHLLPVGSRVIRTSDGDDWRRELGGWCEVVRVKGFRPVVFPHPLSAKIAEFAALADDASRVCAGTVVATPSTAEVCA